MDPYAIRLLTTARHDDLVREADESRLARDTHEESRPAPKPAPRGVRRLRIA